MGVVYWIRCTTKRPKVHELHESRYREFPFSFLWPATREDGEALTIHFWKRWCLARIIGGSGGSSPCKFSTFNESVIETALQIQRTFDCLLKKKFADNYFAMGTLRLCRDSRSFGFCFWVNAVLYARMFKSFFPQSAILGVHCIDQARQIPLRMFS